MCLILSTRSDEQVHRDLAIRNNHMRVLHVYLTKELEYLAGMTPDPPVKIVP